MNTQNTIFGNQNNWPEQEAFLSSESFFDLYKDYLAGNETKEYLQEFLSREVKHYKKVFDNQEDLTRFIKAFNNAIKTTDLKMEVKND